MKEKIYEAIEKTYDKLFNLGYNVIAIFLYGSQNYELSTDSSDIDLKAIIAPTLNDIVLGKKLVSTTIEINEGLCDIKDIRSMMNCWKKQNVNFIELLFTKYRWINPEYKEILQPLFIHNEEIAHYDEDKALKCIRGMQMEKYHALFKDYPSQKEVIKKYGYSAKQLHHIWRLWDLTSKYVLGKSYEECLVPFNQLKETLKAMKRYDCPYEKMSEVSDSADLAMRQTEELIKNYRPASVNEEIEILMNKVTTNVIRKALKSELEEI